MKDPDPIFEIESAKTSSLVRREPSVLEELPSAPRPREYWEHLEFLAIAVGAGTDRVLETINALSTRLPGQNKFAYLVDLQPEIEGLSDVSKDLRRMAAGLKESGDPVYGERQWLTVTNAMIECLTSIDELEQIMRDLERNPVTSLITNRERGSRTLIEVHRNKISASRAEITRRLGLLTLYIHNIHSAC
jgi:hypothetical protein